MEYEAHTTCTLLRNMQRPDISQQCQEKKITMDGMLQVLEKYARQISMWCT